MPLFTRFYFLFFLLLFSESCWANDLIVLKNNHKIQNISRYVDQLKSKQKDLDFSAVRTNKLFTAHKTDNIDFGLYNGKIWYQFSIHNETDEPHCIEINQGFIDKIEFFSPEADGSYSKVNTGDRYKTDSRPFHYRTYLFPIELKKGETKTYYFSIETVDPLQFSVYTGTLSQFLVRSQRQDFIYGIFYGIIAVMAIFNFFIFLSIRDRSYLYYILYSISMMIAFAYLNGYAQLFLWPDHPEINNITGVIMCLPAILALYFSRHFLLLRDHAPALDKTVGLLALGFALIAVLNISGVSEIIPALILIMTSISGLVLIGTAVYVYRKGYTPAKYFLAGWGLLLSGIILYTLKNLSLIPYNAWTDHTMQIGSAFEMIMFSLALAGKISYYKKEKTEAQSKLIEFLQEKKEFIKTQNIQLEAKVKERTSELESTNAELETTLLSLRRMQDQLIHAEKMSSLGQLTAGIAHEIQNPLNFVKNFSEMSLEIIEELKDVPEADREAILEGLKKNLDRIHYHGLRADSIVKNMLVHSRLYPSEREQIDLNKLAEQFLQVTYQNFKAKDLSFNCLIRFEFDPLLPPVEGVPQDIGRVLLNLYNNALYSCHEHAKNHNGNLPLYKPEIIVSTRFSNGNAILKIQDNGCGVAPSIRYKIFQPFFTTKPPGAGSGLGLFISYDVIRAHGGEIQLEDNDSKGATFSVLLPTLFRNKDTTSRELSGPIGME